MKQLAFVVNFSKTEFYWHLAQKLSSNFQAKIYWISASPYWTNYLRTTGVVEGQILDIQSQLKDCDADHNGSSDVGLKRLNHFMLPDRGREKNPHLTEENLRKTYQLIHDFVERNNIDIVSGEITWAVELVAKQVMDDLGRLFVFPHTMRVPSDRFVFFTNLESSYIDCKNEAKYGQDDVEKIVEDVVKNGLKPFYFSGNNKIPGKVTNNKIKLFLTYLSQQPLYRHTGLMDMTIVDLLKSHLNKIINYHSLKKAFEPVPTEYKERSFLLYALQMQPESSVEVLGEGLSNQIELIKWMANALPHGVELWVKEHSNALGVRSSAYYKEIKSLPSVRLIDPFYPSAKLINKAFAVASVSSTICLEAALIGVPSIVFSKPFFHQMSNVGVCRSPDDVAAFIARCLATPPVRDLTSYQSVLNASYQGIIAGPLDYSTVMQEENLAAVALGFRDLLKKS